MYINFQQSVMELQTKDVERFYELARLSSLLQNICQDGERIYEGFTNIVGDVWYAFYGIQPNLCISSKRIAPVQYMLLSKVMENDYYKRWHKVTAGDDLLAVITAASFSEQLKQWLQQNVTVQNAQQQMRKAQNNIEAASKTLQQLRKEQSNAEMTEHGKIQLQQKKQQQFERLKASQFSNKRAKDQIQQEIRQFSQAQLETMFDKSKKKAKEMRQSVISLSIQEGKKNAQIPITAQMQLADQLQYNEKLKKIAKLTGRFKRIAIKKQQKKEKITMARKEMTLGQEVARLLPIEQANLLLPNYRLDFLRRFSDHQTLIFDTKGKDRRGKGPIIICMDESSSMSTLKEQSKAFCLALLMIARKQKRDFAIIPFASDIGDILLFAKGLATTDEILSFSESFLGGGTNYEKPLRASLDILSKSEFNKADVLFVTDGTSFLSSAFIEQFNAMKKQRKFACTAIVLTNLFNAVDLGLVNRFSDSVIEVNDLFDAEEVFSIS